MILHVPPDAPAWFRSAADALLVLHIGGGSVAILSGAAAVSVRKGERLHKLWGTVFFAAMLTMAAIASIMAITLDERVNIVAGTFTFYLVCSAWMTVRRKGSEVGMFERGAMLAALGVAITGFAFGVQGTLNPAGVHKGDFIAGDLVFAALAVFAASLDWKLIRNGGIAGAPRIMRHLWRMCTAWFVASGSFFLGQQKIMPASMHGSPILAALALAPLALMVFWLIRVRFTRWYSTPPLTPVA